MTKSNPNKRKPISKKVRFKVFKRDKFKCVYCGASAPNVVLQIDHIEPVSKGGDNNILNLVTSCFECNSGKRARRLDDNSVVQKQRDQLEELQERKEQLDMMLSWQKELRSIKTTLVDDLKDYWEELALGFTITKNGLKRIKKLLNEYDYDEIIKAMDASAEGYLVFNNDSETVTETSWETAFSKIIRIAKVQKETKENPDLKELFYIRGILRNRVRYYDASISISLLKSARNDGVEIEDLKQLALTAYDMDEFEEGIENLKNNT